jgi:putative aldouronate transport system permease protein
MSNRKEKVSIERIDMVSRPANVLLNILLIALCITCVYPFLLVIATSFNSESAIASFGYTAIPKEPTLYAYKYLFANASTLLRAYGVTIFVTVVGTMLHVIVCALYGYAISRREFKFRNFFTFYMFFTMLFSGGTVPWYIVCTKVLHINNTIWALILPSLCSAWNIIILKTFFKSSVPDAIIESARIDGASEIKTFVRIVCPIALPGLATIALFAMLGFWNNYFNAMMLTTKTSLQNLQLYLYNILKSASMMEQGASASGMTLKLPQESARNAICVISIAPIIFAYPFFQRYFIQGLTIGAVKG